MKDTYKSKYKIWISKFFEEHANARYSAQEILSAMQEAGVNINRVTVYRNLDRLAEDGTLIRRKLPEDEENFYQFRQPDLECENHLHLYCRRCGRLLHVDHRFMSTLREQLFKDYGFTLECKDSTLTGLCGECQLLEDRERVKTKKSRLHSTDSKFAKVKM